ncbi:isopentenyl-diphosphate Delta-isomerase [Saxibacter everestensis]|uniref:Isopentenyl-diphosphate Delta-isomerase n=1 Tax=Saxibacter everestensis TaxID=2909229 RepID=A0ABY8QR72_9MICO|nr:isopentenyl-diphosphate Delta-isomerase [Brevibacteriaceae bacterium ZFBP1038]
MNLLPATERIVLLDASGKPVGTAPKVASHGIDTPLHLGFSCHLLNHQGQTLVTRRALSKISWPGVWTNSFCGHPQPGEPVVSAVQRRAQHELGLRLSSIELALPDFRYHATDPSGVVENEVCPVYIAQCSAMPAPRDTEVMDLAWVDPGELGAAIRLSPWAFSPWLVLQAGLLPMFGGSGEDTLPRPPATLQRLPE